MTISTIAFAYVWNATRILFEYASPAWSAINKTQSDRLEKLQRRAIRIILGYTYSQDLTLQDYVSLGLHLLKHRRNFSALCYGYKLLHKLTPRALHKFQPVHIPTAFNLRHHLLMLQNQPWITLRSFDRSPINFCVKLLNMIEHPTLHTPTLQVFKQLAWQTAGQHVLDALY